MLFIKLFRLLFYLFRFNRNTETLFRYKKRNNRNKCFVSDSAKTIFGSSFGCFESKLVSKDTLVGLPCWFSPLAFGPIGCAQQSHLICRDSLVLYRQSRPCLWATYFCNFLGKREASMSGRELCEKSFKKVQVHFGERQKVQQYLHICFRTHL
jgi:hypothetical protein